MWDKETKRTAQSTKNIKKMQNNCVCKIKKVGKDLVFNLGDGGTDLVILTTNYLELKENKEWGEMAKQWKSGGIYGGKDRLKIRNMKKKLTPEHQVSTGPIDVRIDTSDKNRKLNAILRIVKNMVEFNKKTETSGEFF